MTKFEKKIKLYNILHGNIYNNIYENVREDTTRCEKCRKNNNGICEISYFRYQVLLDIYTKRILDFRRGKYMLHYNDDGSSYFIGTPHYKNINIVVGNICYGFLHFDNRD